MSRFITIFFILLNFLQLNAQEITQNKKKMFGIISSTGDTILAFKFSNIEESNFIDDKYNEDTSSINKDKLFIIYQGKTKGLFSLKHGELIPPIYDKIDYLYDNGFRVEGYLVYSYGKKGFYHPLGKLIAPCEFETIECINHNSDYFKIMIGRKKAKWYAWHYDQWEQTIFEDIDYSTGYDFIIEKNGYIKNNNAYDSFDLSTNKIIQNNIQPNIFINNNYSVFCEENKCGIKDKSQKIIVEAKYEVIHFDMNIKHIVRVSQNGLLFKIDLIKNIRTLDINNEY
jgi:hypothetical protein